MGRGSGFVRLSTLSCNSHISKNPDELTREMKRVFNSSPIGGLHEYDLWQLLEVPLVWTKKSIASRAGKEEKDFSLSQCPMATENGEDCTFAGTKPRAAFAEIMLPYVAASTCSVGWKFIHKA